MNASLLDTDIFSHFLKGNQKVVNNVINYLTHHPTLNLSSISYFEVLKGLEYKIDVLFVKQSNSIISFFLFNYSTTNFLTPLPCSVEMVTK